MPHLRVHEYLPTVVTSVGSVREDFFWSSGQTLPSGALREASPLVFWFLVCYATTQLAIQLHQERIYVARSNRAAWKRPAESNRSPAMDLGFDICKRKHTDKRRINKPHIHKHATCRNSIYTNKDLMSQCILLLYCCGFIFHCVCHESGFLSCDWFVWLVILIYYGYTYI